MSQPDITDYPLSRVALQPHARNLGIPSFDEMKVQYDRFREIRSLGLPFQKAITLRPTLCIELPSSVTKENFLLALTAHNRHIIAEEGQVLDHDHDICPIDHLFCSKQGQFTFDISTCIAGVVYVSEGNPHALFVHDILLSESSYNQPYKGDELAELNKDLYNKVWLPITKLLGGTFVLTSEL